MLKYTAMKETIRKFIFYALLIVFAATVYYVVCPKWSYHPVESNIKAFSHGERRSVREQELEGIAEIPFQRRSIISRLDSYFLASHVILDARFAGPRFQRHKRS